MTRNPLVTFHDFSGLLLFPLLAKQWVIEHKDGRCMEYDRYAPEDRDPVEPKCIGACHQVDHKQYYVHQQVRDQICIECLSATRCFAMLSSTSFVVLISTP